MFDSFRDYMYYLLTSPFKKVKKAYNQWYILFRVLGGRFDDAMESLHHAGDQTMLATCEPEMLSVHAADRKMARYPEETDENFRIRMANYQEVLKLGGTDAGVLLAVKSIGYDNPEIIKAPIFSGDYTRWAEFYVVLHMDADDSHPIPLAVLQREVRKVKYVTARDNYCIERGLSVEYGTTAELTDKQRLIKLDTGRKIDGSWKIGGFEEEEVRTMKSVVTKTRRKKMAEAANSTGTLARVKWIALGSGGVDDNGKVKEPQATATQLSNELLRKECNLQNRISDTRYSYRIRIEPTELVGQEISELAVIDEDGDIVLIANFEGREKYEVTREFVLDVIY